MFKHSAPAGVIGDREMGIQPKAVNQAAAAAPEGVGLGLESFVEGGGLFTDFDGTITDAAFVEFDYGGTVSPPVLALALEILNEEVAESSEDNPNPEQPQTNPFIQHYSAGDLTNLVPSSDDGGARAIPVGSKTGISKSTNAFAVIASMRAAGYTDPIGNSCKQFIGLRFHWKREAQKERKGLKAAPREDGRAREVLLAESFLGKVGEAAAGPQKAAAGPRPAAGPAKPNGAAAGPRPVAAKPAAGPARPAAPAPAAKPTAAPAAAATIEEDVAVAAGTYIMEVLAGADGNTTPKMGLAKGVIEYAKVNKWEVPLRNKVIQALGNEAFLSTEGLGWVFDGANLSLG